MKLSRRPAAPHLSVVVLVLAGVAGCAVGHAPTQPPKAQLASLYMAADSGHPGAQLRLGQIYGRGDQGVVRDYGLALEWLERAADNGSTRAREVYDRWTRGERARKLVVAAIAAHENGHNDYALPLLERLGKAGVADAAYARGRIALEAPTDAANADSARQWLHKAASLGNANARYLLGALDAREDEGGRAAARHWNDCAVQGHAMCQYSLGLLYLTGDGVSRDAAHGRALIRHAADQGYDRAADWVARWEHHCADPTLDRTCP